MQELVPFTVALEAKEKKRLAKLSVKYGVNRSFFVREMIKEGLKHFDAEKLKKRALRLKAHGPRKLT